MEATKISSRKTQEQRKREAIDEIIEASLVCLGKYGYQGTSLNRIAVEARCSRELPRYHFGSKEALVIQLLDRTANDWTCAFLEPLDKNLTGTEAMKQTLEHFGNEFSGSSPEFRGQLVLILAASDPANASLTKPFVNFQRALRNAVYKALTDGENGGKREKTDIEQLVNIFIATARGLAFQWLVDPQSIDVKSCFLRLLSFMEKDLAE